MNWHYQNMLVILKLVFWLFLEKMADVHLLPIHLFFVVIQWTDSASPFAVTEKMIMSYNQELCWCNGVPTKHDKALKWIQSIRGNILSKIKTKNKYKKAHRPGSKPTNGNLTFACKLWTQSCWSGPHINASLIAIW